MIKNVEIIQKQVSIIETPVLLGLALFLSPLITTKRIYAYATPYRFDLEFYC